MQEYYFLFALALVYTIFAVVQDFRKREVANWLNFSLVLFALAYRAFYSIQTKNYNFLLFGLLGVAIFFGLAHAFYYSKAFAGGDAKLFIAFGAIFPFETLFNLFSLTITFIFVLFLTGTVYSLLYSLFIVRKNKKQFKKEFSRYYNKYKKLLIVSLVLALVSLILLSVNLSFLIITFLALIPFLYIYTLSLDKCMTSLYPPSKLTEGDWLENDVKVAGLTIKKTVHGLSLKEIKFLQKHHKSVLVKEGIPFTPAFLITLLILIYVFLKSPTWIVSFFNLF